VVVYGCFYSIIVQWTILRALHSPLIRLSDNGTYAMLNHVGDLLTSVVYILVYVVFVL
jgi:hypothetical protein